MATAGPDVSLQNLMDKFHLSQDQLDQEVSEEHLRKVSRIIDDHVVVGYELGLSESEMTAINHDERTQERQRLAMLMQWKRKVSWNATYGKLLEALLECCRADPAREVCKLLSQKELQPPAKCMKPDRALGSERNGSLTLSSFAAQRFLSEEEVETKVNDFSKRFNKMALDTLDELEKGKVNPKRVILLFNLPSAYLQTRNEHMKFLDTLNAAADLLDLFNILSRYWDHFNYDLLERLIMAPRIDKYIDHERCSQLQRDMKKYVCEMGEFRRQTTIGVYWKIFVKKRKRKKEKVPEDFEELVRNKEEWSEINTLQDVEDFRREVAEEYQLHECLVFFKYILSGSVIIILWIPIVSPVPSIGPQSQDSYTAEEHVNTEGDVSMMRSEESKNMNYPSGLSPSYNRTPKQMPSGFLSEDKVKGKVENFSMRFNKMTNETMVALEESETSPKKVIVFLTMPSAYLETRDEHMEFLDTLNKAASIMDLLIALNKYWDHFNYHLLEHLITVPGIQRHINKKKRVQLQRAMKEYVKDLDMFRRQTTLGVYCTVFVKQKMEVPKGFKELVTVHEWSKMDTLQKVEDFRQEVARKHKLHDCLVFFKNILFHSVEVIWWIPIVAQHASIGLKLQGSCTAEERVNTEGEEVQERVEDIKSLQSPVSVVPSHAHLELMATGEGSKMAQQATDTTLGTNFGTVRLMKSETLGTGAYGQVCRAMLDGKPCAAKLLHPILVDPNNPRNLRKFEQECRLLSEIQHPNIVQCLGVTRDGETGLPVLLMELMDESLTHFLEQSEEPLAYHMQVNISHDIALAVAFLHSKRIIHRDLSSNNVLLSNDGSRAKVTDFGMSKLDSHMTRLTKCPGTPAYMAPEALLDPPVYTEKLDCFQVGVLMIQTITRKFPDPGPAMNRVRDAKYPRGWCIIPVPEVERRQNHLSLIPQTHPMLRVALNCLKDMDSERPSAQHICEDLSALKDISQYGRSLLREGEQQIQQLKRENQEKEKEIKEKERETEEKKKAVRELEMEIRKKEMYIREREREREVLERDRKIESLQSQLRQLEEEVRKVKNEYYDILLLGRTGTGKSTTGNKLLGINKETLGVLDRLKGNYFDTSSVHQECKVLSNKHNIRVMDTRGFADTRLTKQLGLLEANQPLFQGILQEKKKHNLTFRRVLYFLPYRGPPERAEGTLHEEIKVMYELLGMDIFNIMVIIATNRKKHQMIEFDEDDMRQTKRVFTAAFERVTGQHLPTYPPVLYLPFDETDVLNKVVAAEVISDLPYN